MNILLNEINQMPVHERGVVILALGQTGYVIKSRKQLIYIDPYLTDSLRLTYGDLFTRLFPPPLAPEEINNATAVFCTHGHGDHLDLETLSGIAHSSPQAQIIVPHFNLEDIKALGILENRIHCPLPKKRLSVSGIEFMAVPAAHPVVEYDSAGYCKHFSYLLFLGAITIFHAGDTVLYPGLVETLQQYAIDIAILPINGRDYWREKADIIGNLDYREAVQLAAAISAKVLIPSHNDLFAVNRCNPAYLVDYLDRISSQQRFHFLQVGEAYQYVRVD